MWRLAILTLAAALTAAHGSYAPSSWEKMLALLMQDTDTDTTIKADTGKCGKLCYVRIPETANTPESRHLLKVGEAIVDPFNECNRYFCEAPGVREKAITCPNDNKLCENGKARIKLPGKCCKVCNPLNNPGGNFTDWEEWTECSMTCGGGKRARRRRCQLLEDGTSVNCFGVTLQIGDCFTGPCPVNCEWKWSSYSGCSVSCGVGTQIRYPIITKQPMHGGRHCPLYVQRNDTESKSCGGNGCPVNCKWREWEKWTTCSKLCGGGKQTRTRGKIPAKYGGKDCVGTDTQEQGCNTEPCPIDCKWLAWNQWTTCSKSCGGGKQTRTRGKIPAKYGGKDCVGSDTQEQGCNTKPCPIDCKWLEWNQWTTCSKSCGGGKQTHTRGKIPAKYGGKNCVGSDTQEQGCNTGSCPTCKPGQTKCEGVCIDDRDGDCVADPKDNCKDVKNKGQANWDGDKFGDICDNCMYEPNDGQENADKDDTGDICDEDYDNDGRVNTNDNCPKVYNPDQKDSDRDGYGDACGSSVEEAVSQEKNMSPKEKTIAAKIMEKLLEMYYRSK